MISEINIKNAKICKETFSILEIKKDKYKYHSDFWLILFINFMNKKILIELIKETSCKLWLPENKQSNNC